MFLELNELFRFLCNPFCLNYKEEPETSITIPPLSIYNSVLDIPNQNLCIKTDICQFLNNKISVDMLAKISNDLLQNDNVFITKEVLLYSPILINETFINYFNLKCCLYNKKFRSLIDKKREKSINEKYNRKTEGKIDNITNYFSSNIDYTLICATYFTSNWKIGFDKLKTTLDVFTSYGEIHEIEMMKQTETFLYYEIPGLYKVILLPYTNDNYQFMIVLPEKENDIEKIQFEFQDSIHLQKIIGKCSPHFVDLRMPKFKIEKEFHIETNLIKNEDFKNVINSGDKKNLKIIHKTKFKIDECGTTSDETVSDSVFYSHNSNFYKRTFFFMNKPFFFYVLKHVSQSVNQAVYVPMLTGKYFGPEN